ncbi:MAG: MCE family protein [Solirubrobacterales bacterium]|nr:MCE family protein [Solirubrobacterales bacterium]
MRRSTRSAFANPVLVGAVTVLIVLVGVFLAYNANRGLPFVPTKELKVDIANGADLIPGNDVREGGYRIGIVSAMDPVRLPDGQVGAQLTLRLSQGYGSVPVDSTVTIRPVSVLGSKYVDLHKGVSPNLIPDGGTLPISQTRVPVQSDDVFKTFDPKTRRAVQLTVLGLGDSLAGRGSSLNDTIATLPALLGNLAPVARYLSDPRSQLTGFLQSLGALTGTIRPVAPAFAQLFTDLATTFEALSRDPAALESTIAQSPSTLSVGTASLRVQQPFLANLTTLGRSLTPATAALAAALPVLNPAVAAGTRTLARTPILNANLQQLLGALRQLALAPGTNEALRGLTGTVGTLNPMVRYLGPYQTVCDDWNYWWTYVAEHLSALTRYGFAQRAMINLAAPSGGGVGQQGAATPVNGTSGSDVPPLTVFGGQQFLHAQSYGAAIANGGNADCETGQRGWPKKLNSADPEGRNLVVEPHTPGDQGPTFHGRAHVPAGETFSRNPTTGPQLPYNPSNP